MYIGVDVHKKVCRAAVVNAEGELVDEFNFSNTRTGIGEFISGIEAFRKGGVVVALESTANLWIPLYDSLEENGVRVVLSNPSKTRLIAEARIKNDKVDARTLAHLLRANMLPLCFVPTKAERDKRQYARHRVHLVKMRTEVKNRVHALLDKHGLKPPFTTLFSKKGVDWLRGLKLTASDQTILRLDLALLGTFDEQIHSMEVEIAARAVCDDRVKLLMTVPGLDYFGASLLLGEICDISRFSSDRRLVAWAGLAPSFRQSGDKVTRGGITKQGNKLVRWVLIQAAQTARRYDERLKAFYTRYARRGGDKKAVVAVAHEMLRIAYFMLTRNEPYRSGRRDLTKRKLIRMQRVALGGS
jgi:transposase